MSKSSLSEHRKRLWGQQNGRCFYCDERLIRGRLNARAKMARLATLDHRVPLSKGGARDQENLVLACFDCNHKKGSMSEERFKKEWGRWLAHKLWRNAPPAQR